MKIKIFGKEIEYKWIIAASSFVMLFMTLGFCSSNRDIYLRAITDALDMSRSAFSTSYSMRFITSTIVYLFFGVLVERFGAKRLTLAGVASLIISCLLYVIGDNVIVFGIAATFLGFGISMTASNMAGYIIGQWFGGKKGTIMGFVMAANGIGGAVAMLIVYPIIYNPDNAFGYRKAYTLVAILMLVVGILLFIFLKDKPRDEEDIAARLAEKKVQKSQSTPFKELIRQRKFCFAVMAIFISGFILQGIGGITTPILQDLQFDAGYITLLGTVSNIALTVFKFGIGAVSDRFGTRVSSNICYVASIVSMILLVFITNSTLGNVLSFVIYVLKSLALPLETIMLPILALHLFDKKDYAKVLGIFHAASTAGIALSGPLYNLCYDLLGSYNLAIYISCALMAMAFVALQFILKKNKANTINNAA